MTVFDCSLPAFSNRRHVGATRDLVKRDKEDFLNEFFKEPLSMYELDICANCAELRRPNTRLCRAGAESQRSLNNSIVDSLESA